MPAMLDDPTSLPIYRVSGEAPYPLPYGPLPPEIQIRQVTLRDRTTIATLVPFSSPAQVPPKLTACLCELLNREIEKGDTYPMMDTMALSAFGPYWFANFGAVMILGELDSREEILQMEEQGIDWSRECLGSFYIKPNYPGRSSHVCNAGFLVSDALRNRGVGRLMGECYLEWAPKLGYTYSVFNLVYETNVASLRIWDALGFKRIGRVKGCGNLRSYPDELIDAIIFGRELGGEDDESFTEERFDKIRYYLKTGTYPNGSDRAEKSRLRSAATHYRLVPNLQGDGEEDILMLKGKEVISDPHKQYDIARRTHAESHGGINKTTASIAEKYHWVRIKETVSAAIRNCNQCKDPPTSNATAAGKRDKRVPRQSELGVNNRSGNTRNSASQQQQQHPHADLVVAGPSDGGPDDMEMQYGQHAEYGGMPVDPEIMLHQWQQGEHAAHVHNIGPSASQHPMSHHPQHHHQLHHASSDAVAAAAVAAAAASANHHHHQHQHHPHMVMDRPHHEDDEEEVSKRLREELEAEIRSSTAHHSRESGLAGSGSGGSGGFGPGVAIDDEEDPSALHRHLRQ